MKNLILVLALGSGLVAFQGCGSDTKATKPEVIPAAPGSIPSNTGTGGAQSGSSGSVSAPQ